jgi:energy-coupling factor transporter transmembrane protein EcfT
MINTFAQIDYLACAGGTVWHRASALGKLLLATAIVLAVVFAPDWRPIAALFGTAIALAFSARLPPLLVAAAASTPLLFTVIFVLAHWSGEWVHSAELALRGMSASVTALWLVGTTPYPDLFAPISRLLPRSVGDSLFLTYRAVFALLARVERLWRALFLRGAIGGPLRQRFGRMGEAVGTVVLSGFDRSQRLYQTMLLRGHSGRICGCRHYLEFTRDDIWVWLVFAWVVIACIVFREAA